MATLPIVPVTVAKPETFVDKVEGVFEKDAKAVETVMQRIAKDAKLALTEVVKYLPAAVSFATVLFPQFKAQEATAVNVVTLIQNAVTIVEAKYAANGDAAKTGSAKLADVLALTEQAVVSLLAQLNVKADTAYVTNLVNVIVGLLNIQIAA